MQGIESRMLTHQKMKISAVASATAMAKKAMAAILPARVHRPQALTISPTMAYSHPIICVPKGKAEAREVVLKNNFRRWSSILVMRGFRPLFNYKERGGNYAII